MDVLYLQFACGSSIAVTSLISRMTEHGIGASSRTREIAERLLRRNREFAEEVLNGPVLLLSPQMLTDSDGHTALPTYWCAAELWTYSEERALRGAVLQWYQDRIVPDVAGHLQSWAAATTWREAAYACRAES